MMSGIGKALVLLFALALLPVAGAFAKDDSHGPVLHERDRDPRTFCPYEAGVSREHLLIFVDVTDGISEQQLSLIRNNILTPRLFKDVSLYGKISLVVMDGNNPVTALKPEMVVCRPKNGDLSSPDPRDHYDMMVESRQRIEVEYNLGYIRRFREGVVKQVKAKSETRNTNGIAPIMESMNEISRSSALDFGDRYEKKTLIVVSNLYHNSRSIPLDKLCVRRVYLHDFLSSRYTKTWSCPSFKDIRKKRSNRFYLERKIRPKFKGPVDLKLWVLHKEVSNSGSIRDDSLISFWQEYFEYVQGDLNFLEPEFESDPS